MENTESRMPKVKDLIDHYEQHGKLNNPIAVREDLKNFAEKPIDKTTKELATYFNSSKEEITKDAKLIKLPENKEKDIFVKDAIEDYRQHHANNNNIPDKDERDLNQNGIDDKKERDLNQNGIDDNKEYDLNQNGIPDKNEVSFSELNQFFKNAEPNDGSLDALINFVDDKLYGQVNWNNPKDTPVAVIKDLHLELNNNPQSDRTINSLTSAQFINEFNKDALNSKNIAPSLTTPEIQKRLDDLFSPGEYKASQIPFNDFKTHLALDEKQVLDKGKSFLEPLLNGGRTEMESHMITSVNDMQVNGRLSIKDDKLHIHPLQPELKEGNKLKVNGYKEMDLTKNEIAQLNSGDAIAKTAVKDNGSSEVLFLQKDIQNNEVLSLPQNKLRAPDSIGDKLLSVEQKEEVSKGKELTLRDPENKHSTIKIDLTSSKGFSVYNQEGIKENKQIDFYRKDTQLSNKEDRDVSRDKSIERDQDLKPDNQRSRGNNNTRSR